MSLPNDVYYDVKHMIEEAQGELQRKIARLESRLLDLHEEVGYLRDRVSTLEEEAEGRGDVMSEQEPRYPPNPPELDT